MKMLKAFILLILAACVGLLFYEIRISRYSLTISSYEIASDKLTGQLRIVQLTDLHDSEFGEGNSQLVSLVADQNPDLILITGDLLDSSVEDTDTAEELIAALSEFAPVYFSLGNHELEYEERFGANVTELFTAAGGILLERTYLDLEIAGQRIRLGGLYGYCVPEKYLEESDARTEESAFLTDMQDTDRYTILLCHMPYAWLELDGINEWEIDCVFAGHAHGGQIIVPFLGGIWAPDQGWFPGRLWGLFYSEDGDRCVVLSRGLGSTEVVPRINNVPEVVTVDLTGM